LGLDIYVGSFTRYYSGEWELVAARVARELGATFAVVRQHNPPDAIRDPEEIRSIVLEWRKGLAESLASHLPEPLDWDESPDAPYFKNSLSVLVFQRTILAACALSIYL
jgi:AcrR family transcriptional regulator